MTNFVYVILSVKVEKRHGNAARGIVRAFGLG